MKFVLVIFFALTAVSFVSHAQEASPTPAVASTPVTVILVPPAETPAVQNSTVTPDPKVEVAEPAAPPAWAEQLIMTAQQLPIVGPIITKILVYAGILSSIITALVACVLTILSSLRLVLNLAGLAAFAEKVQLFQNGKIMYWLKYLSMFNAKKPAASAAQKEDQAA